MQNATENRFFILGLSISSILFFWILLPFISAIFWAIVLSILFYPVYDKLGNYLPRKPQTCALITISICIFIAIIPTLLLAFSAAEEIHQLYQKANDSDVSLSSYIEKFREQIPWLDRALNQIGLQGDNFLKKIAPAIQKFGGNIVKNSFLIGQNTILFFLNLGLMLYLMFFLFRDGKKIIKKIKLYLPLSQSKLDRIFCDTEAMMHATVKGNIIVALVQGGLGGIMFYGLGIPHPLIWTAFMVLASLIPAVGSGIIWAPMVIYYFVIGSYGTGVFVLLFGLIIIGLADNFLRPRLVSENTETPDYIVLFATVGGISLLGLDGFILGPIIAALFLVFWRIFHEENNYTQERQEVRIANPLKQED